MTSFRRSIIALSAAFAMALPLSSGMTSTADAAPRRDVAPFCLQTGSANGPGGSPQTCRFFSYDACLEAGAVEHGNCVANIDYRGSYVRINGTWAAR